MSERDEVRTEDAERGVDRLRELGKLLPHDRPDDVRREGVRSALLIAASEGDAPATRRRAPLVFGGFVAGALAAAAVAVIVVRTRTVDAPVTMPSARIESSAMAELERSVVPTPTGADEIVRVRAGKLRLAVPALRTGDHVRVKTGDAEVEGIGAYEIEVRHDALASVTVTAGSATVRVDGQQAVFLAAGQTWGASIERDELAIATPPSPPAPLPTSPPTVIPAPTSPPTVTPAPAPTVTPAPTPTQTPAPIRRAAPLPPPAAPAPGETPHVATPKPSAPEPPTPTPTPTPTPQSPAREPQPAVTAIATTTPPPAVPAASLTETHFRTGSALLRANRFAEAADELAKAADAGGGPLAIDARYFQAVALVKAKRGADAERALVAFLDRAPTSIRRGRAAVMLARLLAERGDPKTARAWYEMALRDPDPSVAAAAQAGLDALPK